MERHVGVGLLREAHSREVDVEHAAALRIAGDVMDEGRDLSAVEAGERQQRRVPPAAVRELEAVGVGLDRQRVGVTAEDDARQHAAPAKAVYLLAEDGPLADGELLGFGHVLTLSWVFVRSLNYLTTGGGGARLQSPTGRGQTPRRLGRAGEIEDDAIRARQLAHLGADEMVETDAPNEDALEILDETQLADEGRAGAQVGAAGVARRPVDVTRGGVHEARAKERAPVETHRLPARPGERVRRL